MRYFLSLLFICVQFFSLCAEEKILRIGHFPNLTHAQAVIAHGLSRKGRNWLEDRLGSDIKVEWYVYNAGPSAMEALFSEAIDCTFVGPSPTINAYVKSGGDFIRIISGACSGGAALVVQGKGEIKKVADFKGKKIATPQFGSTQDVSARIWFKEQGFKFNIYGGDVMIIPTQNADQLALFKQGSLDAAWTTEPWVSRLELESNGKIFLEERALWKNTDGKYVTTHLVTSKKYLNDHAFLIKNLIAAFVELTLWIQQHPEQAKALFQEEFQKETGRPIAKEILDRAWPRLDLTYDPIAASLFKYALNAFEVGYLKEKPDLQNIYNLKLLDQVLLEKGLPKVSSNEQ